MGGIQTLNIGLHNLGTFRSLVFMSSGWFPADRDYSAASNTVECFSRELLIIDFQHFYVPVS